MTDFHPFEQAGEHYLFFTRSARLYQISPSAYRVMTECFPPERVSAAVLPDPAPPCPLPPEEGALYGELRELLVRELEAPPPAPYRQADRPGTNRYRTFSIYLAQTCNMACCYCWNRGGSFGKPGHVMGWQTAQRTTRMILDLAERSSAEKIFVNFYGGEPLLDFPVLRQITRDLLRHEAQLGKRFHLTLDTNGTLLKGHAAQFLARHFTQIGVSLDGIRRIHDLQRPGKYGEVTWQRIVNNIRSFPNPKLLGLRATLTTFSDSYLETFRHLTALGVGRIQIEYCHEPGYHDNPIYEKLIVPPRRQLDELLEFVDYYVDYLCNYRDTSDIPFVSNLLDNLIRIRRGNRFTKPCGAGTNTLAINSHGCVYPCIAFVDHDEFLMGQAATARCLDLRRPPEWFDVDRRLPCRDCWLRYDCAGGCYATHYDMTGNPRKPHPEYCRNMRGRAEVHLHALTRMLNSCPWHLEEEPPP